MRISESSYQHALADRDREIARLDADLERLRFLLGKAQHHCPDRLVDEIEVVLNRKR